MKRTPDIDRISQAELQRPQGVVLKGQFTEVWRSSKGKIKGLQLRTERQTYRIKLPKYLRPMLVRELAPHAFVQVWAHQDEDIWRGINIMPLSDCEAIALRDAWDAQPEEDDPSTATATMTLEASPQTPQKLCVKVCRKGKCFKQGGRQVMQSLEAAIADDPHLQHISVEAVGCMSACKKGPNIKLSNSKKIISGVTPDNVVDLVTQHA